MKPDVISAGIYIIFMQNLFFKHVYNIQSSIFSYMFDRWIPWTGFPRV